MLKKITNHCLRTLMVLTVTNFFVLTNVFADDNQFGVKWGGNITTNMYWDSRATTGARESIIMFLPKNKDLNFEGKDINDKPNFYWGCMASILHAKISAPSCLGANISGFIETEFLGQAETQTNVIRLRNAYVNLDWGSSILTIGQDWNPMALTESYPLCLSVNGAAPIIPSSRNPQIRFQQKLSSTFSVLATAYTERDMVSTGHEGGSVVYQKNALIPALNLMFKHQSADKNFSVGASGEIKTIKPYNHVNGVDVDAKLTTFAANAFLSLATGESTQAGTFTIRFNAIYGGNLTSMVMPGGYGIAESTISNGVSIPTKYTPFNNVGATIDLGYSIHKNAKIGILAGVNKNLGTTDEMGINNSCWTAFDNAYIDGMMRIAPRFSYQSGNVRFGAEVQYTQAAYGSEKDQINNKWQGKWKTTDEVSNIRFLLATTLFF